MAVIHAWLQVITDQTSELCEEWIVSDYEDIPANYVGEHDIDPSIVEELYQGQYNNDEDFVFQMADELGLVPEGYSWPTSYIDWTAAARDLMMDYGESGGHYFRTSY